MDTFNTVPNDTYTPEEIENCEPFDVYLMASNEDCSSQTLVILTLIYCGQSDYMLSHFESIDENLIDIAIYKWELGTGNIILNK